MATVAEVRLWGRTIGARYAKTAGVLGSQRDKITRTLRLKFDRRGILTSGSQR